ncbi:tRNA glutamyl-Q(34) synthetase GluQRS [Aestuariicella hydrocarbonica]|uniref:Glutamyl-Q tRNA(Asp) synthetase n=1 Tax=Pseudomaricurvus hydrocarbonicus TaxID=1470433 RepID=A0A9E5MM75_9GAMM|nr:tRNA glutamyl-Q(34) synthetase GluQRS [Aestuariicella hydrocarbonica]
MKSTTAPPTTYIGRFAPSPTGELHQGSLLTAVASFLDARQQQGQWLVRMEDLDPPREQPGAADEILHCLEAHHLHWDGPVMYQSRRLAAYEAQLQYLSEAGLTYPCNCTRKRLRGLDAYDGHCRLHPPTTAIAHHDPMAIRLKVPCGSDSRESFEDLFQGPQSERLDQSVGDFVIRRKDGLFAYQLAVVVDDIEQGITHILRGSDLLESSARQRYLFGLLGHPAPQMGHLPVLVNDIGQKLSKQTYAEPVRPAQAAHNLVQALVALGQQPPAELIPQTRPGNCTEVLQWGIEHWDRAKVPRLSQLPLTEIGKWPES